MRTRGPGKVLPLRPGNATGAAAVAPPPAASAASSKATAPEKGGPAGLDSFVSSGAECAAALGAHARGGSAAPAASDGRVLASHPPPAAAAPCTGAWRCAPWVQRPPRKGELAEVWPKQLTGAAAAAALRAGGPIVLRGTGLSRCGLRRATVQTPRNKQQQQSKEDLPSIWKQGGACSAAAAEAAIPVLASPARVARLVRVDAAKNAPGSYYELLRPGRWGAPLAGVGLLEWRDCWLAWDEHKLLLTVDVCGWEVVATPTGGAAARVTPNASAWGDLLELLQPPPVGAEGSSLPHSKTVGQPAGEGGRDSVGRRLADGILDWQQLQLIVTAGGWAAAGSLVLQVGPFGCLLPARYETYDTLVVQLEGARRVLLVPPDQAFRGLVPYPVAHPYDGYSCVDLEDPELEYWPSAAGVRGFVVDLRPGDTLLIPAYWFAHTQLGSSDGDDWACGPTSTSPQADPASANGGSAALLVRLQPAAPAGATAAAEVGAAAVLAATGRLLSDGALQLQTTRMVEAVVGSEVGTANVRKWLLRLAEGREMAGLQLGTPVVYRRLRMCELVLEQLQCVLSLLSPNALESLVSEGRAALLRERTASRPALPPALPPPSNECSKGSSAATEREEEEATGAAGDKSSGQQGREESDGGVDAVPTGQSRAAQAAGAPSGQRQQPPAVDGDGPAYGSLVEAAARALLALMCDGRLIPTDWLNEGVEAQRHLLIEPDAEAARYPQLFRHRLLSERPDWKSHARLLPPRADARGGPPRGMLPDVGVAAEAKVGEAAAPLALPAVGSKD